MFGKIKNFFANWFKVPISSEVDEFSKILFYCQFYYQFKIPLAGSKFYREEPVFRQTIQKCNEISQQINGYNLSEAFEDETKAEQLIANKWYELVLFIAFQLALCDLWRDKKIYPEASIGMSVGEITACYLAEVFTLEEAITIINFVAVATNKDVRTRWFNLETDSENTINICRNAPKKLYFAGNYTANTTSICCLDEDVEIISKYLEELNIKVFLIKQNVNPYHTPLILGNESEALKGLSFLNPRPPKIPIYSSFKGSLLDSKTKLDGKYWMNLISQPMFCNDALESAYKDNFTTLVGIEREKHPIHFLTIETVANQVGKKALLLPSVKNGENEKETFKNSVSFFNNKKG